jgi:hypothetical protein
MCPISSAPDQTPDQALQPLLSAQVLLALGAGQPSPIASDKHAGDADVLFQPGALQGAAGHCLLEQALGSSGLQQLLLNEYGLTIDPAWVVNWHIGVRQQGLQAFLAQQQAQGSGSSSGSSSDEALRAALLAAYNSADARWGAARLCLHCNTTIVSCVTATICCTSKKWGY